MRPEWTNNPDVMRILLIIGASGLVAFLFMVWVFAFYW